MQIKKFSGEYQNFSPKKIYKSNKQAGGSSKLAKETLDIVKKKIHKDITTKEILKIVLSNLGKKPGVSEKYDLKRAMMSLGPTGFPFEKYFAKILQHYGYETKVGTKIKGKMILHEVDIVANKNKKFMIECKYHNQLGIITRLHPAMYTYARFLALKQQRFDQPWLVTNTKCSLDAKRYAKGVGLKITGWSYPEKESLQKLISEKNLYPITILKELTNKTKEILFENNIITLKDFEAYPFLNLTKRLNISKKETTALLKEVDEILAI